MSDMQCGQQGQLVVVTNDLKGPSTPRGRPPARAVRRVRAGLGHAPSLLPPESNHNGSECVRPPQCQWTTPAGEERYAPVVISGSMRIERALVLASLRAALMQPKRDPAP
jgi:hypothetical protein